MSNRMDSPYCFCASQRRLVNEYLTIDVVGYSHFWGLEIRPHVFFILLLKLLNRYI